MNESKKNPQSKMEDDSKTLENTTNKGDETKVSIQKPQKVRNVLIGPTAFKERDTSETYASYATNSISTSKYSMFSFFPKCIFDQFRKVANFYFLLQTTFMAIGYYTDVFDNSIDPVTTGITLVGVVGLAMIMEALDDIARHKQDRITNSRLSSVIPCQGGTKEMHIRWDEIKVLDFVVLRVNEALPADMIVLATAHEDGLCYVETKNIDGETNLKIRKSNQGALMVAREGIVKPKENTGHDIYASELEKTISNVINMTGKLEYETPNNKIDQFGGKLEICGKVYPCDSKTLLLRGSILRNTTWVIGLVVFTGSETKVIQNTRETPSKMSHLQHTVNRVLIIVFLAQFTIITCCDLLVMNWMSENVRNPPTNVWYLYPVGSTETMNSIPPILAFWFTYFVLYCNFIPISLYVTLEFCNMTMAKFINADMKMYNKEIDALALCRSTNLVQELGQVEYIFSDKTGTLTQNKMQFKCCLTRGVDIIQGFDEVGNNDSGPFNPQGLNDMRKKGGNDAKESQDFLTIMSVCHTCTCTKAEGKPEGEDEFVYNAESPDEKALIEGAALAGLTFIKREANVIVLRDDTMMPDAKGKRCWRRYQVLAVNEFNSTRKRMSCVVRVLPIAFTEDPPANTDKSGKILLLCKGADSFVMDLADNGDGWSSTHMPMMCKQLSQCAIKGLRTLVMAQKEISESECNTWIEKYNAALSAMEGRKEKLAATAAEIEVNMHIVGASAIEDKLQDGIAPCIASLHEAEIKLWVLTGDKMETAINIGKSTEVLQSGMRIIPFDMPESLQRNSNTPEAQHYVEDRLKKLNTSIEVAIKKYGDPNVMSEAQKKHILDVNNRNGNFKALKSEETKVEQQNDNSIQWPDLLNLALVITGPCLSHIIGMTNEDGTPSPKSNAMESLLRNIGTRCVVVIGCRVSPLQKALVVRLIKEGVASQPICLAIGDGANDVSMIQEAHVGIGIRGLEGMQAVNSSDFAIGQFKFLTRLLLVHGRWNYRRSCKVILYTFYKNMVVTLCIFYYSFYTGFSGTLLYEEWVYTLFNSVFCAYPIIAIGIFDQDLVQEISVAQPKLYMTGLLNLDLNNLKMAETVGLAIVHSIIVFMFPLLVFNGMEANGIGGFYCFGTTVYSCIIITCNLRAALITYTWNWVSFALMAFTIVGYFGFLLLYSNMNINPAFHYVGPKLLQNSLFWCLVLAAPAAALLFDLITEYCRLNFFSDPIDIARNVKQNLPIGIEEVNRISQVQDHKSSTPVELMKYHKDHQQHQSYFTLAHLRSMLDNHKVIHNLEKIKYSKSIFDHIQLLNTMRHHNGNPHIQAPKPDRTHINLDVPQFVYDHAESPHTSYISKFVRKCGVNSKSHNKIETQKVEASIQHHYTCAKKLKKLQPGINHTSKSQTSRLLNSNFLQQELNSVRLILTVRKIKYFILAMGTLFIILGTLGYIESSKIFVVAGIYGCPIEKNKNGDTNTRTNQKCTFPSTANVVVDSYTIRNYRLTSNSEERMNSKQPSNEWIRTNENYNPPVITDSSLREMAKGEKQVRCNEGETCQITFTIPEDMPYPIQVFYNIDNFYQNHNRYVFDRCDEQLSGDLDFNACNKCTEYVKTNIKSETYKHGTTTEIPYAACGLIAQSMFNDKISLLSSNGIDEPSNINLVMNTKVSWSQDDDFFKNPTKYNTHTKRTTVKPMYIWPLGTNYDDTGKMTSSVEQDGQPNDKGGFEDDRFKVWMRVAAFPNFSKILGIIEKPEDYTLDYLKKGSILTFDVQSEFDTTSFDGSKSIIIRNKNWFGQNTGLELILIFFGVACFVISFGLTIRPNVKIKPVPL